MNEWHIPQIGAPSAWDLTAGSGVTIAILDSGVDPAHPDLALVPGWNAYDGNNNTADVYGHGTKVAGAAAAVGNNAVGVVGVSWQSRIMPIRVSDSNGYGYWSTMANGITWAADNGAKVANLSFQSTCGSATVHSAAQYMRNKGGVVIIAAGNSGGQISDSASDAVTCVSATTSSDTLAGWSSFGAAVDVAAPGEGIWTTVAGGGYGAVSGTSFAAPVTAGVYALMLAANKNLGPTTLDSILRSTARDLGTSGYDAQYGYGRIDASAAVTKASQTLATDTTSPTVSLAAPTGGSKVKGLAPVDVAASDNVGVVRVELYANGNLVSSDALAPFAFSWDTTKFVDGPATLAAKAFDAAGNMANSSPVSVTVANDAIPPTVTIASPTGGSTVTGTVPVSVNATDNTKVAKITLTIDGRQVAIGYGSTLSYSWDTSATATKGRGKNRTSTTTTGTSTIVAVAEDPAGNAATTSVTVAKQ